MVIVAWNSPSGSLAALFDGDVFRSILGIFITYASLNFLRATVDIVLSLKAWKSLRITQIVRYLLKFAVAAFWVVVMAMGYSYNLLAVAIYLVPNMLAAILFLLPPNLRTAMETSNLCGITLLMWWAHKARIMS
ncbi:hypothetical protein TorRG33x02_250610 [Trema orientale]|uniref:Uncharacterized protein n=1 Tax=Trema orientale TaxID=63057 RepID=A0A2P5DIL2_TREOI|nr:hypothetical protein TorRG33x02_250610 [Trema orientale]